MVVPRKPRKIRGHPGASWHPCAKHAHAAHFSEPFSTLGISWDPIARPALRAELAKETMSRSSTSVPGRLAPVGAGSVPVRWNRNLSSAGLPESQGFFQQSWKVSFATRSSGYPGLRKCQGAFGWSHATQPVQSPKVKSSGPVAVPVPQIVIWMKHRFPGNVLDKGLEATQASYAVMILLVGTSPTFIWMPQYQQAQATGGRLNFPEISCQIPRPHPPIRWSSRCKAATSSVSSLNLSKASSKGSIWSSSLSHCESQQVVNNNPV